MPIIVDGVGVSVVTAVSGCGSVILGVSVTAVAEGMSGSSWDFLGTLHHISRRILSIFKP